MTGGPAASRRVGVFGGAFDPPHIAHMALARAAMDQLQLDELRIFPTGQAWHKTTQLSAPEHRLAMAQIAFSYVPGALVDDREIRRSGPTYTIDTLRELKAEQPSCELYLIMGEDQAQAITRWREWEAILGMVTLCMAGRPSQADNVAQSMPPQARLYRLSLAPMPESATEIRHKVTAHEGIDHLVAPGVARYIARHHLYSPT